MLLSISDWWNSLDLSTASFVFVCIAIPATLFLLIQTVMMFIGIGSNSEFADSGADDIEADLPDAEAPDGDIGDTDVYDGETDAPDAADFDGLRIITVRGVVAFFVMFGWTGLAMDRAGCPLYATLPVAFVAGSAVMILLAILFKWVMKLQNDGNINNRNAIGVAGKVYLTVPSSRKGMGKVNVMIQGSYVERNAVTDEDEDIPTGSEIVVIGVSGDTDLIVKRK